MPVPVLYGADGKPLVGEDGFLVPHARSFATIWNAVSKTYSYRWDEAVRDNPQNALAARRDVYTRSLLQERVVPTINRKWQLEVDNDKDPMQSLVRDGLTRIVKAVPRLKRLKQNLLDANWYGRYGVQFVPVRGPLGWQVGKHIPVNGDKIQYQWDGTPVVFINPIDAEVYRQRDRAAVLTADDDGKGVVLPTDRGAMGLRLYKPEYRDRYIIHTYIVDDADYFDGEMAGGVHGVGLRSIVYWANWVRQEVYSWMLQFCESTGMMDLLVFNYPSGNTEAKKQAEANAKAVTGKIALACPRSPNERYPAVETVPANAAGMEALKGVITDLYEKPIERMIVGQSMSDGGDGSGELGGTGRAEFAKATKAELLEWDADNLDETLTTDLIGPLLRWNYPGVDFPVRFKSSIPDPERAEKLEAGQTLVSIGVPVKADELRQAAGFTKPGDGDEVAGGQQQQPGAEGGSAATQEGDGGEDKEPSLADLFERLKSVESLIRERPVRYSTDAHGNEHAPAGGPSGGQFIGKGGGGGQKTRLQQAVERDPRKALSALNGRIDLHRRPAEEWNSVRDALAKLPRLKLEKKLAEFHADWLNHLKLWRLDPELKPEDRDDMFAEFTEWRMQIVREAIEQQGKGSAASYSTDAHGHEHAGKGEGGGRFVGEGGSGGGGEPPKRGRPKAEFHHEHTADMIEDAAKKLRGALNAAYNGKITDEKLTAYADKWQRVMQRQVEGRYAEALESAKAKLEADFGSDATQGDEWAAVRKAFLLASGYTASRVAAMANMIREHAGNEHFDTDELKRSRRDFEYEVGELRHGISQAHNAIYDALKPLRDRLAGDKKGQYKLGRYFYVRDKDGREHAPKGSKEGGQFTGAGGGKGGSAASGSKAGRSGKTTGKDASGDRVAAKVRRLMPTPDELKQLAESGDTRQTRERQDALDARWEEVIRIALGGGWKPGGSGSKPADFKGTVRLKSGEECPVIGDGKIIASKKQTYSVRDQAVRNKLVESARNPHSVVTIVAVNYSPEATPEERGVYLIFGAPGSISLKNQGAGTKSEMKPVKLLSGDELGRIGEPGVMSQMKSRYVQAVRGIDLKRYKAMEKQQAIQRSERDATNTGKIVKAAMTMGASVDEAANAIDAGFADVPEDVKRRLIEKWSKKDDAQ